MKRLLPLEKNKDLKSGTAHVRYEFLDLLRGILMICVIVYHLLYDLTAIVGINIPWLSTLSAWYFEQITAGGFIFVSGICANFSRNNLRRGVTLVLWGFVITVATFILEMTSDMFSGTFIRFGILTCLGFCNILTGFFSDKIFDKINKYAGAALSIILYLFTRGVPMCEQTYLNTKVYTGFLGIERFPLIYLPEKMYTISGLEAIGLPSRNFLSADYFPLIPFFFLFMFGYFVWKILENKKITQRVGHISLKPFNFIGRHSIWVYLLHQPALAVILGIILLVSGKLF